MRIAETLNSFRKRIGYTQSEVAAKSGVTQAYISAVELGNKHPTDEIIEKIADALGISFDIVIIAAIEPKDLSIKKESGFDEDVLELKRKADALVDIAAEQRRLDKEHGMK